MDINKEVIRLNGEVVALRADVNNLTGWQRAQNGTIQRVDAKVDKLQMWMLGMLGTSIISLALLVANLLAKRV